MQILVVTDSESFPSLFQQQITGVGSDIFLHVSKNPTKEELEKAEILLPMPNFSTISLSEMPNLKWVHVSSAGVNGVVEKLRDTEIVLTNSSGVHPVPIAEQVFAYMLMFARGMHLTMQQQFAGTWNREVPTFELHGKAVAIIGLGRIGEKVAELAKGFGMTVLAVKTKIEKVENIDQVFVLNDLSKVLMQADFVVNCLPGTDETKGLFGKREFGDMKSTAYFINIGRGQSVVESELIDALQKHVIAGAGLDVFEEEPLPSSSHLWSLPNVILTPHTAGKTPEYLNRVVQIFCENLQAYMTKTKMPNEVDKEKGY